MQLQSLTVKKEVRFDVRSDIELQKVFFLVVK